MHTCCLTPLPPHPPPPPPLRTRNAHTPTHPHSHTYKHTDLCCKPDPNCPSTIKPCIQVNPNLCQSPLVNKPGAVCDPDTNNPLCDTLTCCMLSCEEFAKNQCGVLRPRDGAANIVCPGGVCNTGMSILSLRERG